MNFSYFRHRKRTSYIIIMKRGIILFALFCGMLTACNAPEDKSEELGQAYLQKARVALRDKNFNSAKQFIKEMRDSVPLAIEARKSGILLMDSIELHIAQEELNVLNQQLLKQGENAPDSVRFKFEQTCQKIKFYIRKIAHDRKAVNTLK